MPLNAGRLLLVAFCLAQCCRASDIEVTLVTLEGDEQSAKLLGISAEGFQTSRGLMAAAQLSEVRFSTAPVADASPKITLRMRNQDMLVAAIISGDDSKLKVKSDTLGEVVLQNKFLDAIVFRFKPGASADVIDNFLKEAPPKEDLLLLPKGDTVSGFIEKFTDKELTFNAGGQSRAYAFDAISGFRLAPLEQFKAPDDLRGQINLRDGSRLNGKLLGLKDNALSIEALNGQPWPVATEGIRNITFTGGKLVYLSELKPAAVDEKPYVGGVPFVYSWKRNVSVTGSRLTIGAKSYDRGIGMHSYCRLVYALDGGYAKFLAETGLDNLAPAKGNCAWKVLVDGKEAAGGTAKAGEAAKTVKISLAGAKQLELICDYGDDDDAGDHFDWGGARLIKP